MLDRIQRGLLPDKPHTQLRGDDGQRVDAFNLGREAAALTRRLDGLG